MTEQQKLLPCICGGTPHNHKYPGVIQKWVQCEACLREVTAPSKDDAGFGWNAWMKALTEARQ